MVDNFGMTAFNVPTGFSGDVNRTHPVTIEPVLNDATVPVLKSGLGALINASGTGVRSLASGDTAITALYGVAVRAFPIQQNDSNAMTQNFAFGGSTLPSGAPIDVMRSGYMLVSVQGTPTKGATVYVWVAASSGAHVQGGFEASASGGSTATLSTTYALFNGPPDGNGVCEIMIMGGV